MKAYLKLFRFPNVLMVGLTLILMRYAIIAPILSIYEMELKLPLIAFLAYTLATMLVAATGYAINDYFDRNLDLINRNLADVVVEQKIPAQKVLSIYWILNVVAILLAGFASFKSGKLMVVICYPVIIGWLYFYSTTYKKQLLVGNIIVSISTALVPFMVYLFEMPPVLTHYKFYIISGAINLKVVFAWISGFSVFAFFSTLAREIIKDMEDFEGDRFYGRHTIAIAWGISWAKGIAMALIAIMVLGLAFIYYLFFALAGQTDFITLVYFSAFIIIPLAYNLYQLFGAKTAADYKFCGDVLKLIMLTGILYAPVVWYIIYKTFEI